MEQCDLPLIGGGPDGLENVHAIGGGGGGRLAQSEVAEFLRGKKTSVSRP